MELSLETIIGIIIFVVLFFFYLFIVRFILILFGISKNPTEAQLKKLPLIIAKITYSAIANESPEELRQLQRDPFVEGSKAKRVILATISIIVISYISFFAVALVMKLAVDLIAWLH